ncbi:DiGeorge syndrome critical region protein 14, partial [Quaeritorhiza haematococci]
MATKPTTAADTSVDDTTSPRAIPVGNEPAPKEYSSSLGKSDSNAAQNAAQAQPPPSKAPSSPSSRLQTLTKPTNAPATSTSTALIPSQGTPDLATLLAPLAKRPHQEVLAEDDYVEAVSEIIQRDFFPDLKKMRLQNEFLDAVQEVDLEKARAVGAELARMSTGK